MVGSSYERRDACPECGSRAVTRKKDTAVGRPRDNPEPYTCKRCFAHFEEPDEVRVLVPDD